MVLYYTDSLDELFEVLQEQEVMCFVAPTRRRRLERSLSSKSAGTTSSAMVVEDAAEGSLLCSAVEDILPDMKKVGVNSPLDPLVFSRISALLP